MTEDDGERLFELADRILAVGRVLHAAAFAGHSRTPLESAVMRVIDRRPGITAGAAAEATQQVSSNFSRALRKLEADGLIRREADPLDARRVHLHPSARAGQRVAELQRIWSDLLAGIVPDPHELDTVVEVLTRIETALADRRERPPRPAPEEST